MFLKRRFGILTDIDSGSKGVKIPGYLLVIKPWSKKDLEVVEKDAGFGLIGKIYEKPQEGTTYTPDYYVYLQLLPPDNVEETVESIDLILETENVRYIVEKKVIEIQLNSISSVWDVTSGSSKIG